MIDKEELEHELDSKNHTIRMLQKQLVSMLEWHWGGEVLCKYLDPGSPLSTHIFLFHFVLD